MPKTRQTRLQSLITATLTTSTLAAGLLGAAGAAQAMNPYAQPDEAWISLSGTVDSVSPDIFTLDYGDGSIFVEMDDGDRDGDAYKLIPGDKVTVTGRIDDDLFESTSIKVEAGDRVHVTGQLDEDFFTAPELMAESIVVLEDASKQPGQQSKQKADTTDQGSDQS